MVAPAWIRDTETFWYRNRLADGCEFVFVDAAAGSKRPAFDHERLAKSLNALLGTEHDARSLPFFGIELTGSDPVRVVVGTQRVEVSLETYEATVLGPVLAGESQSPDGKWSVGVKD